MRPAPTFTVLICTRDRPEELERCLRSVSELDYPDFEILVVDSAPQHQPAREAARRWNARYIFEPVAGVSRARNCGVRASDSEFVAIIDDEAIADRGLLRALEREFADAAVACVAGRIKDFPAHTIEERLCAALGGADCGDARRVVDRAAPLWFERACFGGIGNGGNLAFRRAVFDVWSGFCESLGAGAHIPGGEEHYAFFSLIDRGFRVVYSPDAVVSHPCPRTMAELRARHARYLSASVGYMALLFTGETARRGRIIRYVLQALRGVRRPWRTNAQPRQLRVLPRWRTLVAVVRGLQWYLRSRFAPAGRLAAAPALTESAMVRPAKAPATVIYLDRQAEQGSTRAARRR